MYEKAVEPSVYRDLAALSPGQPSRLRQSEMEPADASIPWKDRRIKITERGFPIFRISDRCVVMPSDDDGVLQNKVIGWDAFVSDTAGPPIGAGHAETG
jgi:hypothetical protein